jgi:FixJ family two-component response regulator
MTPTPSPRTDDAPPTVFVIDDDPDVLEAIGGLLQSVGLQAALFASVAEFLAAGTRSEACFCLVLDIRLPGRSGLDFHDDLVRAGMRIPVVFISGHADIAMSVRAMKAGAVEFLTKPTRDQDLLDAIQTAIARDRSRRRRAEALAELRSRYTTLTPREQEVMALVVAGKLNKQIAAEVGLSERRR